MIILRKLAKIDSETVFSVTVGIGKCKKRWPMDICHGPLNIESYLTNCHPIRYITHHRLQPHFQGLHFVLQIKLENLHIHNVTI